MSLSKTSLLLTIILSLIFVTANGQAPWYPANGIESTANLDDIDVVNSEIAYAAGVNGTILKTIDGGENWSQLDFMAKKSINAIYFVNEETGWVGGRYLSFDDSDLLISKTTDGGETWERTFIDENIYDFHFDDISTGWAACKTVWKFSTCKKNKVAIIVQNKKIQTGCYSL
jgi:photosystem II stability/assembly factor-like uncharacterized protein